MDKFTVFTAGIWHWQQQYAGLKKWEDCQTLCQLADACNFFNYGGKTAATKEHCYLKYGLGRKVEGVARRQVFGRKYCKGWTLYIYFNVSIIIHFSWLSNRKELNQWTLQSRLWIKQRNKKGCLVGEDRGWGHVRGKALWQRREQLDNNWALHDWQEGPLCRWGFLKW